MGLTLAQFSAGGAEPSRDDVGAAARLVQGEMDMWPGRSIEDMVADAVDLVCCGAPLVEVARHRRSWDEMWGAVAAETERLAAALQEAVIRQWEERVAWERWRDRYPRGGGADQGGRAAALFEALGVPGADRLDARALRAAWVGLMKRHHPDRCPTVVDAQEINAAHDVLRARLAASATPLGSRWRQPRSSRTDSATPRQRASTVTLRPANGDGCMRACRRATRSGRP